MSDLSEYQDFLDTNRRRWDETVPIHLDAPFYRVAEFLAGESSLDPLIIDELGDVRGLKLLHLQCHFGLDTLSLARAGAQVTGVDFSAPAIEAARTLSQRARVPARFVHCDLYEAPHHIDDRFDRVFSSWGTLNWLPDCTRWASIIAGFLKPGGAFYIADGHPLLWMLDDGPGADCHAPRLVFDYFRQGQPLHHTEGQDYADPQAALENVETYQWNHGLGEIVTALSQAGLRIDFLHEHDRVVWQAIPHLERIDAHYFAMPPGKPSLPLSYSLRATRL